MRLSWPATTGKTSDQKNPQIQQTSQFRIWLCGELIRRIDGRSIGSLFSDEGRRLESGVANIPRELDPADPLARRNPQSAWKRQILGTLGLRK